MCVLRSVFLQQAVQAIMNCVTTLWKLDATKFEAVLAPLVTRSAYLLRQRAAVGAGQQGHLNTVALQQLLSGLRDASCVVARPDYLQVRTAFQGRGIHHGLLLAQTTQTTFG